MSDFQTMKARIATEMKRGELTASASQVQSAVISAIDFFKRRRFWFNEVHDTTLSVSTSSVTLPASFIIIDSVKAVIGSRDYPLQRRTWHEIDSIDSGQWTGYPEWYSIHGDQIRSYPPPNDTYVYKLSGVVELTEISANASAAATNSWMTDAEEMIRCQAKGYLFRDEVRNFTIADIFFREAQRVYRELNRENRAKLSSNRIRPTMW